MNRKVYLFDWGDTIMKDFPEEQGSMYKWNKIEMMPFADKVLEDITKTADCYIATNAKDSNKIDILKALKRVNLHTYFKDIFCYKEIGYSKPTKEYFDVIVDKLNVNKKNLIMVGDNLAKDVEGAINYGIKAILYDPSNKYPAYKGLKISSLNDILNH